MKKTILILIFVLFAFKVVAQIRTDIYTVQQDTTLIGKKVMVIGIVTASTGIFNPGITYIEDKNGGPWSGICLWESTANFYLEEGKQYRVIGEVAEYYGKTQINIESFYPIGTGYSSPPAELVKTSDIATGSPTAESYESVLVRVDSVFVIDNNLGYGDWLVDDGSGACRIDDEADFLDYNVPVPGTHISSITGILNYSNNNFKLEPRYRSDIADNDTSGINTYTIQQIQQGVTLIGKDVALTGIVTAATGIFHPQQTFIEDAQGGQMSGISLWDSSEVFLANQGDEVHITGRVFENNGMTEISVHTFEIISTANTLPPIELLYSGDISPGASKAEFYEGVLVLINDVYVADNSLGGGDWKVNDASDGCVGIDSHCLVGDDADSLFYHVPLIGTHFTSITGILVYKDNNFKLEPRYISDIIESATSPIGDTLTIIQRPILTVPAIIQPGDTLKILCDLSQSPSSWQASVSRKNQLINLISLGQVFNDTTKLWTLKALLPETNFYELYDLKLEIPGEVTDLAKQAVKIIPYFEEDFYFIHITDTHFPTSMYCYQDGYQRNLSGMDDLLAIIDDINLINPAFVLHTGDFIHEGELETFLNNRYYTKAKQILSELDVPVYLVAGNHDIGGWDDTPMPDGTSRKDWWRFFGWKSLNNPTGTNPKITQDYTFNYGNCHFIGLEAYLNYESWRYDIYGGSSFTGEQIEWLNNTVTGLDDSLLKVLFYHYDFKSELDLDNLGIDLALWGHGHSNSGSIFQHPFKLQTASGSGRRAYRLIRVRGNTIIPAASLSAGSSGENLQIRYINNSSDSSASITAEVKNLTNEKFEHALIKFGISPGQILNIKNGTLSMIDSLSVPWTAYVTSSIPPQSTTQIEIQYLVSGVDDFVGKIESFRLAQNYPNPFNSSTRIGFSVVKTGEVVIKITDINGKLVLQKNIGTTGPGSYSFVWHAKDNFGEIVPSGVYFYTIRTANYFETKKMILLQ